MNYIVSSEVLVSVFDQKIQTPTDLSSLLTMFSTVAAVEAICVDLCYGI